MLGTGARKLGLVRFRHGFPRFQNTSKVVKGKLLVLHSTLASRQNSLASADPPEGAARKAEVFLCGRSPPHVKLVEA